MDKEKGKRKPKETKPPEQYWVRFNDVTVDDLNAILGIYKNLTERQSPMLSLGEHDLDMLREDVTSSRAFSEIQIEGGFLLEARRRISGSNEMFVRFKVRTGTVGSTPVNARIKVAMQSGIDTYFLSKEKAVPLRDTF